MLSTLQCPLLSLQFPLLSITSSTTFHRHRHPQVRIHHNILILISLRVLLHLILHSIHVTLLTSQHQFRILLFLISLHQLLLQSLRISLILQLLNIFVQSFNIVIHQLARLLQRSVITRHQTLQLLQSSIPFLVRQRLILHLTSQLVNLRHLLSSPTISLLLSRSQLLLKTTLTFLFLIQFPFSIRLFLRRRAKQRHNTQQSRQTSHQPTHRAHRHHSIQSRHSQSRQRNSTSKQTLNRRSHHRRSRPSSTKHRPHTRSSSTQQFHSHVTLFPSHQQLFPSNHHTHHRRQYTKLSSITAHITTSHHHSTTKTHRTIQQSHINRAQLLTKLRPQIRKTTLRLLQLSLKRIVRSVIFRRHRRTLSISSSSLFLTTPHLIQIIRQSRQSLCHTATRQLHLLKHRSHLVHTTTIPQSTQKLQQSSIRVRLQQIRKLLHIQTRHLSQFSRLLKQSTQHILQSRRTLFHTHHRLIQHRSKTKNIRLRNLRTVRHTRQPSRKFQQIRLRRRRTLRQIINRRSRRQHTIPQTSTRISSKQLSNLTNVFHSIIPQILTQSHRNLISSIHKLQHLLLTLDTQTTSIRSQIIQSSTRSPSVQFLKTLIQFIHRLRTQSRIFHHTRHMFLKFRILLHIPTHSIHRTTHSTHHSIHSIPRHRHYTHPVFTKRFHPVKHPTIPTTFLITKRPLFIIQLLQLTASSLYRLRISIPLLTPTFHTSTVQFRIQFLYRRTKLFWSRLVQASQHRLHSLHTRHTQAQLLILRIQLTRHTAQLFCSLIPILLRSISITQRLFRLCLLLLKFLHTLLQLPQLFSSLATIHPKLNYFNVFLCHKKIVSLVFTPKIRQISIQ